MQSNTVTLELGAQSSVIWHFDAEGSLLPLHLNLGIQTLASRCFHNDPPQPIEMEHAIEVTEEIVMPFSKRIEQAPVLLLTGIGRVEMNQILETAGVHDGAPSLSAIESLFTRLTSISQGRPKSQDPIRSDKHAFALLVIVRELMHHLKFDHVQL